MIKYQTIREGIARCIMKAFPTFPIDDDDARHLEGPSFLVRLADNMHKLDDAHSIRRVMAFNVVYFAPHHTPKENIYEAGLRLACSLQPTIAFGNREITVYDVETRLIDEDFQVDFTLDFFDELREKEKINYMQALEFTITIGKGA